MADQAVLKYLSIGTTFDPCWLPMDSTFKVYDDKIGSAIWFYDSLYTDTDDRKRPTRPVDANSIVVKTLRMVLRSSRDGVPLKLKKKNGRPDSFKIPINWYHFRPLLAADGQYL